jgi:hypothetical protein
MLKDLGQFNKAIALLEAAKEKTRHAGHIEPSIK